MQLAKHTHTHTSALNRALFAALPYSLGRFHSAAQLRGPWGHSGGLWSCPNSPKSGSGEVPLSFVCDVCAGETSAAQCADLGVRLPGSRCGCSAVPRSHATIYPSRSPLPWRGAGARRPAPAAIIVCAPPAEVSDNRPAATHICLRRPLVRFCAGTSPKKHHRVGSENAAAGLFVSENSFC